ncbi:unnamed protein product [Hymenolepis diminuta]|uniref:Uncharacterized protein n=1 Tax=Hymenolepis diminuta TaxID=6216 RepID=A0A0R3SQ99_HYMDI|nr:unnamed protein product [Hymenolepis diminuta]
MSRRRGRDGRVVKAMERRRGEVEQEEGVSAAAAAAAAGASNALPAELSRRGECGGDGDGQCLGVTLQPRE